MKLKKIFLTCARLFFLLAFLCLSGCGETIKTHHYYNPVWLSDGRILAVREETESVRGGGLLGGSTAQDKTTAGVILTLGPSGNVTSEQVVQTLGYEQYRRYIPSPLGNYVAARDIQNGKYGLLIYDRNFQVSSFIDLDFDHDFDTIDWSPDESELIIQMSDGLSVYSRSGVLERNLSNIRYLYCWRFSPYIMGYIGDTGSYQDRFVLKDDSIYLTDPRIGATQYFPDGQSFFSRTNTGYEKISVSDFTVLATYEDLNTAIKAHGQDYSLVEYPINPVNPNQVLFSGSSTHTFDHLAKEGIYLINLDGTNEITVKE